MTAGRARAEARRSPSAADETVRGELRVTTRLDEQLWRSFVQAQATANIFHTPEMYRVFEQARRHRPRLWAVTDAADLPLAILLPVEVTVAGGPLRPWTARTVAYGGVGFADDEAGRRALRAVLATYRRTGAGASLFTELRHLSDPTGIRDALRSEGFVHEPHLNYLIDLDRDEENLWRSLSKTAQQRVRSGQKKGVVVGEVADPGGQEDAYRLLEQVYRRVGVPLADRSLFQAAFGILNPRGMFRIVTARLGDRLIGARYLLTHKDRIIDWYAGADRTFASYSPNEILVWETLRWGRANGYRIFDFGGAGRPDEPYGPRDFKSKFGGQLVDLGRDTLVHAPTRLRLSRAGYAVARELTSRRARRRNGARAPQEPSGGGP